MKNKGIIEDLQQLVANGIASIYGSEIDAHKVVVNQTKKEFDGDYTVVLFPYVKQLKTSPQDLGEKLMAYLKESSLKVVDGSLVSGFLNIQFSDQA